MTEVNAASNIFQELNLTRKQEEKGSEELGQKAFLELMITQLEHQDPLSPQENGDFIAQLAQFSSVESLDQLNNNFDSFADNFVANQALQASSLVGSSVSVATDTTQLYAGDVISASVEIPASTNDVDIKIYDSGGSLVEQLSTGPAEAGEYVMRWDGQKIEVNGELQEWESSHEGGLPAGKYRITISSSVEGKQEQLETYLSANVNSVTVGVQGALTLNLAGVGAVDLADVKQFNE